MTTKPQTFDRFDYGCMAILVASLAFISLTCPALYVLLWIVACFVAAVAFSVVVANELIGNE
jgi:hypothetical protein